MRLLLALFLAASPALAEPGDVGCRRDLLVAESGMRIALEELDRAGDGQAERCRAWRAHVAAMRRVGATFGRCLAGGERAAQVTTVEGRAREFEGLVRDQCRGR